MGGDCVDFEDLVISTVYNVGDSFYVANSDDSLSFNVHAKDFTYANGTTTSAGMSKVENGGNAGHNDQEMAINNILLEFIPASHTPKALSVVRGSWRKCEPLCQC